MKSTIPILLCDDAEVFEVKSEVSQSPLVCDAIKQNESELPKNKNSSFNFAMYVHINSSEPYIMLKIPSNIMVP